MSRANKTGKPFSGSKTDPQGRGSSNNFYGEWAEKTPGGYIAKKVMRATGTDNQRTHTQGKTDKEKMTVKRPPAQLYKGR